MGATVWMEQGQVFECDSVKRALNLQKHGIDLVDATPVFFDPYAVSEVDKAHSHGEERFTVTGQAEGGEVFFVSYTFRDERIRIISARNATKREREGYGRQ